VACGRNEEQGEPGGRAMTMVTYSSLQGINFLMIAEPLK
jgi:hypothetical protein